jgi:hypothetical protein
MTKYLLFSAAALLSSCKSEYKALRPSPATENCFAKFDHEFETAWYSATIDVHGHHLSGLLLIKNAGQDTYRIVFTSEAGVTFFDFQFSDNGDFRVKKIIKQIDRKPVISVLRHDFALLLRLPFKTGPLLRYEGGDEAFMAAKGKNGTSYFITDRDCASLHRLEIGSARKRKVTLEMKGLYDQPEGIEITHHTFDMVIKLKKIERE